MVCEEKERALTESKSGDSSAKAGDVPDLLGSQDLCVVVNVFLDIGRSHVEISETPKRCIPLVSHEFFKQGVYALG